jgi:predicted Fe-S protein YdhL (DUF1289 family)
MTGPRFTAFGTGQRPSPGPDAPPAHPPRAASPCINVCRMDDASGFCEGCRRTIDEIAVWSLLDTTEREAVWQQLDARRLGSAP